MEEIDKDELKKIAYNCRKATFLIEKKQLTDISLREQLELKVHLAGCSVCRIFEQQSLTINKLVKNIFKNPAYPSNIGLDPEFKKRLEEQIKNRLNT